MSMSQIFNSYVSSFTKAYIIWSSDFQRPYVQVSGIPNKKCFSYCDKARCVRWEVGTCCLRSLRYGLVWKCWVYIPNEIAIFHRDNDQQDHWVQWGTLFSDTPIWILWNQIQRWKAEFQVQSKAYFYLLLVMSYCSISSATLYFFPKCAVIHQESFWSHCNISAKGGSMLWIFDSRQ